MKLFYYKDPIGNFGDDLNEWLWPKFLNGILDDNSQILFLGIGSIISSKMNIPDTALKLVFGSGVGYGNIPEIDHNWKFYFVRGPLTAKALGLPPEKAITDSAALLNCVVPKASRKLYRVAFIPHHQSTIRSKIQGLNLLDICKAAEIEYIDPAWDVDTVLQKVSSAEIILAEAMHGAIVADSLRIPWIPIKLYDHILDFKWQDWCKSLALDYRPINFNNSFYNNTKELINFLKNSSKTHPFLSEPDIFNTCINRIQEKINNLIGDINNGLFNQYLKTTEFSINTNKTNADVKNNWLTDLFIKITELVKHIPSDSSLVLVDQDEWMTGGMVAGRKTYHFIEKDGTYGGPPDNSNRAIEELKKLIALKAKFLVFTQSTFWWLDYYIGFQEYLKTHHKMVFSNQHLIIFELNN